MTRPSPDHTYEIALARERDRPAVYRLRHDVYAAELGQHSVNDAGRLIDALDAVNEYLVLRKNDRIVEIVDHVLAEGTGDVPESRRNGTGVRQQVQA